MKFALKVCAIDENESIFLDIVRLLSAQFVFFGHLLSFSYGSEALIGGRIPIQNLGVVVFFILSGYLICRTLPKYVDFKEFFIDRFARIYVTLVPCLLVIAILDYFMKANGNFSYVSAYTFTTWIGNLFMLQDYPVLQLATSGLGLGEPLMTSFGSARPLWTLAVEWWLYMFVGYVCLTKQRKVSIVAGLAIVPFVFATVGRGQGLTLFWLLGGAIIYVGEWSVKTKYLTAAAVGLSMLYCARIAASKDFYDLQANFFLSALFCALLMWSRRTAFFTALPAVLKSLFRVLAGASFALYLLHYSIIELLRSFGIGKAQVAVLAIVTANVLAVLIYLVFDKNHKKLGMRLRKMAAPAVKSSGDAA